MEIECHCGSDTDSRPRWLYSPPLEVGAAATSTRATSSAKVPDRSRTSATSSSAAIRIALARNNARNHVLRRVFEEAVGRDDKRTGEGGALEDGRLYPAASETLLGVLSPREAIHFSPLSTQASLSPVLTPMSLREPRTTTTPVVSPAMFLARAASTTRTDPPSIEGLRRRTPDRRPPLGRRRPGRHSPWPHLACLRLRPRGRG